MVLEDSHLDQFAEEGDVVVRDLLDWDLDSQPVQDEYDEILDRLITKWHADERLSSTCAGLPWFRGPQRRVSRDGITRYGRGGGVVASGTQHARCGRQCGIQPLEGSGSTVCVRRKIIFSNRSELPLT